MGNVKLTCILSRKYPDAHYFVFIKIPDKTNLLDNPHSSNKNLSYLQYPQSEISLKRG